MENTNAFKDIERSALLKNLKTDNDKMEYLLSMFEKELKTHSQEFERAIRKLKDCESTNLLADTALYVKFTSIRFEMIENVLIKIREVKDFQIDAR